MAVNFGNLREAFGTVEEISRDLRLRNCDQRLATGTSGSNPHAAWDVMKAYPANLSLQ